MNYGVYKPDYTNPNRTGYALLANFETINGCVDYIDNNKSIADVWSWLYISKYTPKINNEYMIYYIRNKWLKYYIDGIK